VSIQMQALADFARHRAIGRAVRLEQKVGRAVDLDRAEAASVFFGRPTRFLVTREKRVTMAMSEPYPTP